jgi:hypothetical protein
MIYERQHEANWGGLAAEKGKHDRFRLLDISLSSLFLISQCEILTL